MHQQRAAPRSIQFHPSIQIREFSRDHFESQTSSMSRRRSVSSVSVDRRENFLFSCIERTEVCRTKSSRQSKIINGFVISAILIVLCTVGTLLSLVFTQTGAIQVTSINRNFTSIFNCSINDVSRCTCSQSRNRIGSKTMPLFPRSFSSLWRLLLFVSAADAELSERVL